MGRFGNLPNHPHLPKDLDDWDDLEIFPMIQIFPNIQICDVGTPLSFLEKKAKRHPNIESQSSLLLINHPNLPKDLDDWEDLDPKDLDDWEDLDPRGNFLLFFLFLFL